MTKRIIIAGGGTAGWMTAAALSHRLKPLGLDITLIESSAIGTVGVGEATVPAIKKYFEATGLDIREVMRATNGTLKLGIEFADWRHPGHRFFHSFGQYGVSAGHVPFHHLWQRMDEHPLDDYCLGTQLAYAGRFAEPTKSPRAEFEVFDWAIHFDAGLFAAHLRRRAEADGVTRIDARITSIDQDSESGDITALSLDNGRRIEGDLFIDCSGFRGLLIQQAVGSPYRDWRNWLPCDRAVALPCAPENPDDIAPLTRATAQPGGWMWRIPLQHRVGNGYVYSSAHISDDDAEAALRQALEGEALAPANRLQFTAGHVEKPWKNNCIAIGLAGGFLEPLESTSITLIQVAIEKLIALWPARPSDPRLAAEFNQHLETVYARIRDFLILHYCANRRQGESLWDQCRSMELPDSLQHRVDLFRAGGHLVRQDLDSFFEASWLCMFEGFGIRPDTADPWAERFPIEDLRELGRNLRADIAGRAANAEPHLDYLIRQGMAGVSAVPGSRGAARAGTAPGRRALPVR
ncbi:tryptophan halogenase family protein [Asticcacaulis sp. AC460]|uniref:tryptophan halogenase family protein n=1 Tax=Asticcacaulis sp. AC460 TaxID=1282360 RepID=UPI0009DFB5E4|nr:tryptophan halogenase family protein [Asticcacaulis sp. AC460]